MKKRDNIKAVFKLSTIIVSLIILSLLILGCDDRLYDYPYYEPCIYFMNPDGSNIHMALENETVFIGNPIPGTTKFLLLKDFKLYSIDYTNDELSLIIDTLDILTPRVSPNGQKITFMSEKENQSDLYICNIDGTKLIQLTNTLEVNEFYQSFSYSSESIVYVVEMENRLYKYHICKMNLQSGEIDTLISSTDFQLLQPKFSPDDEFIYYLKEYDTIYNHYHLYVMDKNGSHIQGFEDGFLSWTSQYYISPDNSKIVYKSDSLRSMNSDGTDNNAIVNCISFCPSSDFTKIAYNNYNAEYDDIFTINIDGSEKEKIFSKLASSGPRFSYYDDIIAFKGYYETNRLKNYFTYSQ